MSNEKRVTSKGQKQEHDSSNSSLITHNGKAVPKDHSSLRRCRQCGNEMTANGKGRSRKFCDDKCKSAWHRANKRMERRDPEHRGRKAVRV